MRYFLSCLLVALTVTGCFDRKNISPLPSISDEARIAMERPVNCARARGDIQILEEERASVAKRILSGVRMVFPIAAVSGILLGDYKDRWEVTTGEYNYLIETKIDQIRKTCGVS